MSEQQDKPYDGDTVRDGVTMPAKHPAGLKGHAGAGGTSGYDRRGICDGESRHPEVVVFDMKGTVDLFKQQSAQLQLDEGGQKR
jgi:conjugal transfer pilin signal peptidase TrbI